MAKTTTAVEMPAPWRPVLQAAANNLLHHLYGSEGPAGGTSFAEREQRAQLLSNYLGSAVLQQALQRQAHQPVPPPLPPCPRCGRPTQARDPEPRRVQTPRGTADWPEPASSGGHGRKAFFPSVSAPRP